MVKIIISKQFSEAPGARYKTDGSFSGELFREILLEPRFKEAIETSQRLFVDLDGGYGYAISFLEESFGGLARIYGSQKVLSILDLKSDDELGLIKDIIKYIQNAKAKE
jgi:hypothetical protein